MKIIKHDMAEELAIRLLGWKWVSFVGMPMNNHPDYPKEMRVRQLLSPKQLKSKRWQDFLEKHEGADAAGEEPLTYTYCSSGCSAEPLPKFTILVD